MISQTLFSNSIRRLPDDNPRNKLNAASQSQCPISP